MTRKLPWKDKDATATHGIKARSRNHSTAAATPQGVAGPSHLEESPNSYATRQKIAARRSSSARRDRSPSTSPPPQPLSETFMIDGFENDDGYRMVEDELQEVAGLFTRHLHAAEYHRLRGFARGQNADAIRSISRPVSGAITKSVSRHYAISAQARKSRQDLRKALSQRKIAAVDIDEDDDFDGGPVTGSSLSELMNSPTKGKMVRLAPLGSDLPKARLEDTRCGKALVSRAPASNLGTSETGSDSNDDNLGAGTRSHSGARPQLKDGKRSTQQALSEGTSQNPGDTVLTQPSARVIQAKISTTAAKGDRYPGSDESLESDEDDIFANIRHRRQQSGRGPKHEEGKQSVKQEAYSLSLDAIPSFL